MTSRTSRRGIRFRCETAWYLGTYYGPNDGLVALEDQSLPGLGTVLAVLDVGHTDLTRRFPAARPKHRLRRALVDAIIMAVGRHAREEKRPLHAGIHEPVSVPSDRDARTGPRSTLVLIMHIVTGAAGFVGSNLVRAPQRARRSRDPGR